MGKVYKVYRVDYLTKMEIPVGTVTERRNLSRVPQLPRLMKLARKMFAQSPRTRCGSPSGKSTPPEPHQIATRTGSSAGSRDVPRFIPTRNPRRPPLM